MALSKLFLIPTSMAVPVYVVEEQVGISVFHQFVHDELEHQGLSDDELLKEDVSAEVNGIMEKNLALAQMFHGGGMQLANTPEGYKSIAISQVGSTIRELANEFAQSHQRNKIKDEADKVDLGALNFESFWGLLEEVFRHGMTSHNLVALFFFCSDVLIRCVRQKLRAVGMNLFKWSLEYVTRQVCKWVHDNGGWERVLSKTLVYKKYVVGAAIVTLAAVLWFSYKGIKK